MQIITKEDMAAHKLCAMYERIGKTSRDIYDAYFFLVRDWPINKKIIEKRMAMPYKEFLEKTIAAVEKFSDRNILGGMGELLSEKQKHWVRTKLKTEIIFLLKARLESEK